MSLEVLTITPDGTIAVKKIDRTLPAFRAEIGGGDLELIAPRQDTGAGSWRAYVDEHGKDRQAGFNLVATLLAEAGGWIHLPGDWLAGPVVFFGLNPDNPADEGDVPEELLGLVEATGWRVIEDEPAGHGDD